MALTKITSDVIETGAITSDKLASGAVSASSLSSITTDNVSEGSTNTYFTNARARSSVSVTGGGLSYDSGTGVIQIGSIPNASLTNSSLTVNSNSVSLGGSVTLDTDDIGEGSTNLYFTNARAQGAISGGTGVTVSSGEISIGQDVATSSTPTFGNITTTGYIAGPATFTIDPAAVGDNTGTVVIAGNLQVDGTTTTINSTTMEVDDLNITLASGAANAAAANGAGITVDGASATITYDGTTDKWDFNKFIEIGSGYGGTPNIESQLILNDTGNNYITIGSGASSEGGILFADSADNDAGVISYNHSTNSLAFRTNGVSNRMIINSSGNVGIGDTNPSYPFEVSSGSASNVARFKSTGHNNVHIQAGTSSLSQLLFADADDQDAGKISYEHANDALAFRVNAAERMRIDSLGNIGIGVTPDTLSSGYTGLQINGYAYLIGHSGGDHYMTNNAYFNSGWKYGQTSTAQKVELASGRITLMTAASGSADSAITWNTGLVQDSSGKIGIGTTNPQMGLHVGSGSQSTAALPGIGIANGSSAYSFFQASDGTKQYIAGVDHTITYTKSGTLSNHDHAIITNNTNRIYIDNSGKVGIGKTPSAWRLDVDSSDVYVASFDGSNNTGVVINSSSNSGDIIGYSNSAGTYNALNIRGASGVGLYIDTSNKVIIGDTASHVDDLLQIETPASGGGHGIQIRRNDSNSDQGIGRIMFGNNTDTDLATIQAITDGSTDNARLVFSTQPSGGSSTERMRINAAGGVSINDNVENPLSLNRTTTTTGASYMRFTNGGGNYYIGADSSAGDRMAIGGLAYGFTMTAESGRPLVFATSNTSRMTINSSGNVGIGDADPPSLLTVTGGNTGFVASNGAGIYGIQVSRTTSGGENLYMYTTTGTGWSNSTHVGRVESYGNNAMEIGSQQDAVVSFGTNNQEVFRLRSDGLQFPDNNTFIATSSTPGGSVYEWGAFRRPASSDGGQLTVRQYSSGNTAANYPAYASSNGSGTWDENTGMFFPALDKVGLTAAGNATLQVHEGEIYQAFENGFTSGEANRGQWACLGGIGHHTQYNPGASGSGAYLHIKTNVPKSNIMFRFEYKGQAYNGQNIDTSIIGYTYTGTSYVYSPQIQDTGNTTYNFKTPYYSSDSKLVLVVQIANNYTGGILWAQFCGSHTMTPGTVAIVSTAFSSSTSGAF